LGCKSTNTGLPYIIDFEPYLTFPQQSAIEVLMKMLGRSPYHIKAVVGDSKTRGFHTLEVSVFFSRSSMAGYRWRIIIPKSNNKISNFLVMVVFLSIDFISILSTKK